MGGEIMALVVGMVLGAILWPAKTKRVAESETETLARLRAYAESNIKWREEHLLSSHCGWSRGDELRNEIGGYRALLDELPAIARSEP